jgi:hypothetical protein
MTHYIVWRLVDDDQDLWLPTNCDTFEQAADAWLDCIKNGSSARITEDVPIGVHDARRQPAASAKAKKPVQTRGFHEGSGAEKVSMALRAAPDGLSRKQLADVTGLLRTNASAVVAGLMKRRLVRSEQRPADADRGAAPVGRETVAVYFWIGEVPE